MPVHIEILDSDEIKKSVNDEYAHILSYVDSVVYCFVIVCVVFLVWRFLRPRYLAMGTAKQKKKI